MITQDLTAEGCILIIKDVKWKDELRVYWNADTPERSKEICPDNEIFMLIDGHDRHSMQSISLSSNKARILRDTLDYMIGCLSGEFNE